MPSNCDIIIIERKEKVIIMLKIIYTAKPFYTEHDINEPCTKDLVVEFDQDASSTEIINELIRVLKYAGYSFCDRKSYLLNAIENLTWGGVVQDDTKEEEDNN